MRLLRFYTVFLIIYLIKWAIHQISHQMRVSHRVSVCYTQHLWVKYIVMVGSLRTFIRVFLFINVVVRSVECEGYGVNTGTHSNTSSL